MWNLILLWLVLWGDDPLKLFMNVRDHEWKEFLMVQGTVSISTTDRPTRQRTTIPCYLHIAEWSVAWSDSVAYLLKQPQESKSSLESLVNMIFAIFHRLIIIYRSFIIIMLVRLVVQTKGTKVMENFWFFINSLRDFLLCTFLPMASFWSSVCMQLWINTLIHFIGNPGPLGNSE